MIQRPAMRYFGGKWNLAPWIISHFPEHVCYVEVFGGGASVLLRKMRSPIEVYNDISSRVVNFFRVLRQQPDELIRAINLTPYAREEYLQAHIQADDALEDARRFMVLSGQGNRGAGTIDAGGWRWMKNLSRVQTPAHDWWKTDHLYAIARRFEGVQVDNADAFEILNRYDAAETLFYVDPPYVQSTRCMRWQGDAYNFEFSNEEHSKLAEALQQVKGKVVLSGYPSELYGKLYADWLYHERTITMRVRQGKTSKKSVECIWISPNAVVQSKMF